MAAFPLNALSSSLPVGPSLLIKPCLNRLGISTSLSSFKAPRRCSTARFGSGINSFPNGVTTCFFNPTEDPIVKEALKEPVAFLGGVFAGLLRLDLTEEPLKEWLTRTVESTGITEEDVGAEGSTGEVIPTQIEIE